MSDLIRPRSVTEIVDAGFQLYRRAPLEFMTAAGIIYVPYLLARLVLTGGMGLTPSLFGQETVALDVSMAGIWTEVGLTLLGLLVYAVMDAPVMWLASERYLGRERSAMDAVGNIVRRIPAIIVAWVLRAIAIGLGILALVAPGVWATAITFAVPQAIVIEGAGVGESFRRSASLSSGLKWHILKTTFLVTVIAFAVYGGVLIAMLFIKNQIAQEIVLALTVIIVYPIIAVTYTILYYDARIRREGFDVEWLAASGSAPVPDRTLV